MLAKIMIIAGVLVACAVILPQAFNMVPETPDEVRSISDGLIEAQEGVTERIAAGIDKTIDYAGEAVDEVQERSDLAIREVSERTGVDLSNRLFGESDAAP